MHPFPWHLKSWILGFQSPFLDAAPQESRDPVCDARASEWFKMFVLCWGLSTTVCIEDHLKKGMEIVKAQQCYTLHLHTKTTSTIFGVLHGFVVDFNRRDKHLQVTCQSKFITVFHRDCHDYTGFGWLWPHSCFHYHHLRFSGRSLRRRLEQCLCLYRSQPLNSSCQNLQTWLPVIRHSSGLIGPKISRQVAKICTD